MSLSSILFALFALHMIEHWLKAIDIDMLIANDVSQSSQLIEKITQKLFDPVEDNLYTWHETKPEIFLSVFWLMFNY